MDRPLAGKVALVTGSGRGLGKAIADRLAELGADIAIHDRSQEAPAEFGEAANLDAVAADVSRFGGRTMAFTADVADKKAVNKMVRLVREQLGPIQILVNCAGGDIAAAGGKPNPNTALGISIEDIRALLDRNLIGTMLVCQAVCPSMVERQEGAVVNIASGAAHFGTSPEVVYSVAKAAVVHFTRCLAFELRPHGIRVNVVSPGPTMTARFLATRTVSSAMMATSASLDRYGTPAEVADAVAFLAGEGARFLSGQVIRVDGGKTLFAA